MVISAIHHQRAIMYAKIRPADNPPGAQLLPASCRPTNPTHSLRMALKFSTSHTRKHVKKNSLLGQNLRNLAENPDENANIVVEQSVRQIPDTFTHLYKHLKGLNIRKIQEVCRAQEIQCLSSECQVPSSVHMVCAALTQYMRVQTCVTLGIPRGPG